jgi:hypothetical protein
VGAKHRQVERQGHLVETFRDDRASRQQTDAPRGVIDRALAEMLQRATEIPLGDFPKVPIAVNRFLRVSIRCLDHSQVSSPREVNRAATMRQSASVFNSDQPPALLIPDPDTEGSGQRPG